MSETGWRKLRRATQVAEGVDVMGFFRSFEPSIMIVHRLEDDWYEQNVDACPNPLWEAPTHWQPLPEPPVTP